MRFCESYAESVFRAPALIAGTLMGMGLVLYAVDRVRPARKQLDELTLVDTVLIGVAQAFAFVPGVSQSGATISAARALGATRETAARFSFLLSAPIIIGTSLVEAPKLSAGGLDATVGVAVLSSAAVGYLAIRCLLAYVRTHAYEGFAYYRVALGLVVLTLLGT